jgi:serine/threonine protein kinase
VRCKIADGPLSGDPALSIATQIAQTRGAAHEQGILHRDVRPANVKVRDGSTEECAMSGWQGNGASRGLEGSRRAARRRQALNIQPLARLPRFSVLQDRPESEWITTSAPALRILTGAEWHAAHGRLASVRAQLKATDTPLGNRRARDIESAYLLSGFARYTIGGGGLAVLGGSRSSARRHVYGCLAYHKRGRTVCANGLRIPIVRVHDAVLKTIADDVLRHRAVMAVVDGLVDRLTPRASR